MFQGQLPGNAREVGGGRHGQGTTSTSTMTPRRFAHCAGLASTSNNTTAGGPAYSRWMEQSKKERTPPQQVRMGRAVKAGAVEGLKLI